MPLNRLHPNYRPHIDGAIATMMASFHELSKEDAIYALNFLANQEVREDMNYVSLPPYFNEARFNNVRDELQQLHRIMQNPRPQMSTGSGGEFNLSRQEVDEHHPVTRELIRNYLINQFRVKIWTLQVLDVVIDLLGVWKKRKNSLYIAVLTQWIKEEANGMPDTMKNILLSKGVLKILIKTELKKLYMYIKESDISDVIESIFTLPPKLFDKDVDTLEAIFMLRPTTDPTQTEALKKIKEYIQNPEAKEIVDLCNSFVIAEKTYELLRLHKDTLKLTLKVEVIDEIEKLCSDYLKQISEKPAKEQKPLDPGTINRLNIFFKQADIENTILIKDFFAIYFAENAAKDTQFSTLMKLHFTANKIFATDEWIDEEFSMKRIVIEEQKETKAEAKTPEETTSKAFLNFNPYQTNRILLHACLVHPSKWTRAFGFAFAALLDVIARPDDDWKTAEWKKFSYPPEFMMQMEWLNKLYEAHNNVTPNETVIAQITAEQPHRFFPLMYAFRDLRDYRDVLEALEPELFPKAWADTLGPSAIASPTLEIWNGLISRFHFRVFQPEKNRQIVLDAFQEIAQERTPTLHKLFDLLDPLPESVANLILAGQKSRLWDLFNNSTPFYKLHMIRRYTHSSEQAKFLWDNLNPTYSIQRAIEISRYDFDQLGLENTHKANAADGLRNHLRSCIRTVDDFINLSRMNSDYLKGIAHESPHFHELKKIFENHDDLLPALVKSREDFWETTKWLTGEKTASLFIKLLAHPDPSQNVLFPGLKKDHRDFFKKIIKLKLTLEKQADFPDIIKNLLSLTPELLDKFDENLSLLELIFMIKPSDILQSKALKKINEHICDPEAKQIPEICNSFFIAEKAYTILRQHKNDLTMEGQNKNIDEIEKLCSDYLKQIAEKPVEEQRPLAPDIIERLRIFVKSPEVEEIKFIKNFFYETFESSQNSHPAALMELHFTENKIYVTDPWIKNALSQEENQNLNSYQVNRILMHACLIHPLDWTPAFASIFKTLPDLLLNPDCELAAEWMQVSFRSVFIKQLQWLHQMYQAYHDRASDPDGPERVAREQPRNYIRNYIYANIANPPKMPLFPLIYFFDDLPDLARKIKTLKPEYIIKLGNDSFKEQLNKYNLRDLGYFIMQVYSHDTQKNLETVLDTLLQKPLQRLIETQTELVNFLNSLPSGCRQAVLISQKENLWNFIPSPSQFIEYLDNNEESYNKATVLSLLIKSSANFDRFMKAIPANERPEVMRSINVNLYALITSAEDFVRIAKHMTLVQRIFLYKSLLENTHQPLNVIFPTVADLHQSFDALTKLDDHDEDVNFAWRNVLFSALEKKPDVEIQRALKCAEEKMSPPEGKAVPAIFRNTLDGILSSYKTNSTLFGGSKAEKNLRELANRKKPDDLVSYEEVTAAIRADSTHRMKLFAQAPEEKPNETGTDKVIVRLSNAFKPVQKNQRR